MMTAETSPLPPAVVSVLNDADRLEAVAATGQYGTAPTPDFNRISGLAAVIFQAPVAQVTLLREDESWFKSSLGFDVSSSPTAISFCAHTLAHPEEIMIVPDASLDPRFAQNPFVVEEPSIRFYAGCSIRYREQKVGTLCVYDFEPRDTVTDEQKRLLLQAATDANALLSKEATAG